jgi:hypothetical protein
MIKRLLLFTVIVFLNIIVVHSQQPKAKLVNIFMSYGTLAIGTDTFTFNAGLHGDTIIPGINKNELRIDFFYGYYGHDDPHKIKDTSFTLTIGYEDRWEEMTSRVNYFNIHYDGGWRHGYTHSVHINIISEKKILIMYLSGPAATHIEPLIDYISENYFASAPGRDVFEKIKEIFKN